jgi:hypothetical protein
VPEEKIKATTNDDSESAFRLELWDKKILDLLQNAPDNMMALNTIISKLVISLLCFVFALFIYLNIVFI